MTGVRIAVVVELGQDFGLLRSHGAFPLRRFPMRVAVLLFGGVLALLFVGPGQHLGGLLLVEVGDEPVCEGVLVVVGDLDHPFPLRVII